MNDCSVSVIRLRPLETKDADRMLEWMRNPNAIRFLQIGGEQTSLEDVISFIIHSSDKEENVHRAVVNSDDKYLGTISLKNISIERRDAEYAIAMHPDSWGTGAAREASQRIVNYGFDKLKLNRIYLYVLEENLRANSFYRKIGFHHYATTEVRVNGELKKLNWYEIKKNQQYILSPETKVVFYSAIKVSFGGGRTLFLDLAKYLSDEMGYDTYYIVPVSGTIEHSYMQQGGKNLHIMNESEMDFKTLEGAVFFTAVNHLSYLLSRIEMLKQARILLYFGHPDILTWYRNQFPVTGFDDKAFLDLLWKTNSASFQDQSNLIVANSLSPHAFLPDYVPTVVHKSEVDKSTIHRIRKTGVIRILWMGRLDSDKIYSLINCLDSVLLADLEEIVEFHIIGDGNARNRIPINKYAPKIRMVFTSFLYGEMRDRYILENADLVMSMGICAMDCALLGVPTVIPIVSPTPFIDNKYVYIQDAPNYSVGWRKSDINELGCETYSIKEVIQRVCFDDSEYAKVGEEGRIACERIFSVDNAGKLLLHALSNTDLSVKQCMELPCIKRQMQLYQAYSRLRHGRTYDQYLTLLSWIRSNKNEKGLRKLLIVPRAIRRIISARVQKRKKAKQKITKLERIQKEYPDKLRKIQTICKETGIIKVAFLNLYNGVFPFQALFEKMLNDPFFDPWIIVVPNMSRTPEYRKENYFLTFDSLYEKYNTRVLHGLDWDKGVFTELGDTYQVVCFNNPYEDQVHYYHSANYCLKKNILMIYANYGFAALNFWSEVIHTDFFNQMWKVCVETESNMQYLRENEPIRGENGYLTGYMKMDSMVNYHPSEKTRKKVLICPHHTVWGWETLNISNFLQYAELFLRLPKLFSEIDFVFRPHPLLFDNLVTHNVWTQEEVNSYIDRLKQIPNLSLDRSGDYFQVFVDSDAMIHDCGSFIGEYLYTEKPCCYMMQSEEKTRATLLPTGISCIEQYYHAFNESDIIDFIQNVVISGKDPMRAQRERFSREVLKQYYPYSADRIASLLKKEILQL